ncbi:MAG: H(+)/Cl(-) exchange transporter ClcA [Opitutaceae bacterium]
MDKPPKETGFGLGREDIRRRHLLPKALVVGACTGLIAAVFRIALREMEDWRIHIGARWPGFTGFAIAMAVGTLGGAAAVWLVARFAPEASGSGIPQLKAVVLGSAPLRWRRILPVKFFSGLLGIGGGLALGREGPTIQIGGAVGLMVSRWFHVPHGEGERKALISAGAGAGLAAAFNAPLAGMIFVLEELHGAINPIIFVCAFLASVTSDVVARVLAGAPPIFALRGLVAPTLTVLPAAVVAGVCAGFVGVAFNRSIFRSMDFFERLKCPPALAGGAVGLLSGLAGAWIPGLSGTGTNLVTEALTGGFALSILPLLLIIRFGLSIAGFGSNAAGGIFLPLLVIGALGGLSFGDLAHGLTPLWIPHPEIFVVLGMGALFTAIVRAPLTGIVLMIELTGVYDFMLPLLVSCFAAYGIAEWMKDVPIYEALRIRKFGGARVRHGPPDLQ